MNDHMNHIRNFAHVSADLYAEYFNWRGKHLAYFDKLKDLAISALKLCHLSPNGLFILDTDTNGTQIGTALSQIQDIVVKPICFASHVLLKQHRTLYFSISIYCPASQECSDRFTLYQAECTSYFLLNN